MTRFSILLGGVAVGLFGMACMRDDSSVAKKLEQIDQRLQNIESKLEGGARGAPAGRAAAGGQQRAERAAPEGPDPNKIYSVDIDGDQYEGVKDAKVTVVDAFEFA